MATTKASSSIYCCLYLISLFIASNCSCSIHANVWASVWPLGDSMSNVPRTDSLSSSVSLVSNASWTLVKTCCCWIFSHSCSFKVFTWNWCQSNHRKHCTYISKVELFFYLHYENNNDWNFCFQYGNTNILTIFSHLSTSITIYNFH